MTEKFMRQVRSFVRREGRMTPSQQKALEQLWPKYGLSLVDGALNYQTIFGNDNDVILEIGFGMGGSLLKMAQANPHQNYIGIEVHRPGVGSLMANMEKHSVTNLRIFCEDALHVLNECIPANSLAGVQLFFPDPWPKKRHHKRRIVQSAFIDLVTKKLKPSGFFHAATDWENYAEHMMEVLEKSDLNNQAGKNKFTPRPEHRPLTRFEQRGHRLGHEVWDLIFLKK